MYGNTYNDTVTKKFKAGINEEVTLNSVTLEKVETANYNGFALDFIYGKDGDEHKDRMFPIDESRVTPREVYVDGSKKMQTQEEAVAQAYGNFNSKVKHVICNFVEEEKFEETVKESTSFEDFAKRVISLLPQGYSTTKGQLIMSYDNKGYLQVPSAMWVTGAFFSVNDKHNLVPGKRVRLTPPATDNTSADAPQDTNW